MKSFAHFLLTFFLTSLLLPPISLAAADSPPKRPNVILIITDDQSPRNPPTPEYPGLVSPPGFGYGGDRVLTPHVDRLAREGIVMSNANVSCPVCSPSRYTTLTGRYATRTQGEVFKRQFPAAKSFRGFSRTVPAARVMTCPHHSETVRLRRGRLANN